MNKKILFTSAGLFLTVMICYSFIKPDLKTMRPVHAAQGPEGYTGTIPDVYCNSCHSTYGLDNPGGSVTATGLPSVNYSPGVQYDFSITITHSASDRKKWGFAIAAVNAAGQPVGTFSSTNPNADINGAELTHLNAVATTLRSTYTYTNLHWTAPLNPGVDDQNIKFYFVGNAANGNNNAFQDYIYRNTSVATLKQVYTFTGTGDWNISTNWLNSLVPPNPVSGNAEVNIDPLPGGECVLSGNQHISNTAKLIVKAGKALRITGSLNIAN